ncbi:MAG: hypothetical protein JWN97_2523 [Nocardioides sp.]|nr:hypothetical protein [Nocardioides sp.]
MTQVAVSVWSTEGAKDDICPIAGRKLPIDVAHGHTPGVLDPALVAHVVATTSLTPGEAARVVEDVIAFHSQPVEVYVRERHARLQTYGARNAEIFTRIAEELRERVVAAPELSERQLRRIVYG